jgi:hypothetical protein
MVLACCLEKIVHRVPFLAAALPIPVMSRQHHEIWLLLRGGGVPHLRHKIAERAVLSFSQQVARLFIHLAAFSKFSIQALLRPWKAELF